MALSGVAAGVPYVAVPPAGGGSESVIAVNERLGYLSHTWSAASREAARRLDCVAESDLPVLLVTGEHEYPEFQPDQAALHAAMRNSHHHVVPNLAHRFEP